MQKPTRRRPKLGTFSFLCLLLLPLACQGTQSQPKARGSKEAHPSTILLLARNKLESGQPQEALLLLDKLRPQQDKLDPVTRFRWELLYGRSYLAFTRHLRTNGGSALSVQANYEDAKTHLLTASKLMPTDPRPFKVLAETYKDMGRYREGAEAGLRALALLKKRGDSGEKARVALLTSENLYGQLTQQRRREGNKVSAASKDLASRIYEVIDPALGFEDTRNRAYQLYAWTSQWVGDPAEGFGVLSDAVRETPENLGLQQTFFNFLLSTRKVGDGLEFYRKWARELARDSASPKAQAIVQFYLGSAEAALGDALRREGDLRGAGAAFERAERAFLEAAKLPAFAKNSRLRAALTHVSRADLAIQDGKLEEGQKELAKAYDLAPEVAQVDPNGIDHYFDGARKTYRGLLFRIGSRFVGGGLEKALNYWRFVTKKHPTWGPAWNNLGLSARDLGVRYARSGQGEKAKSLWEESYAAYKKAVQYSGDDPRIVNDCGLMLVYHLKRDYPEARRLLHKAIEIGQAQLDELPEPDSSDASHPGDPNLSERRRRIEEAVGDAWQNLGVLEENLGHPQKALPFYREAVKFYPYKRRAAARKILSLEKGKKSGSGLLPLPRVTVGLVLPRRPADLWLDPPLPEEEILKALQLAKEGKFQEAFERISPLLKKAGEDPEPFFAAGRTSLLLAQSLMQKRERGARNHLADAIDRLEQAHEKSDSLKKGGEVLGLRIHVLPAYDLCQAYILNGEPDKAMTLASRQLLHLDSLGLEFPKPLLAAFFLRAADVGAQKAIADLSKAPRNSKAPPPSLEKARTWNLKALDSLKEWAAGGTLDLGPLEKAVGLPVDLVRYARNWKNMELWARRPKAAISAIGKVLALADRSLLPPLLTELSQVVAKNGGAEDALRFLEPLEKRFAKDANLAWYKGYFYYILGNERRMDPKKGSPLEAYQKAEQALVQCTRLNPGYKASADYWRAMAQTGMGFYYAVARRNKEAKKAWFQALAISDKAATTGKDPLISRTAKLGILGLGGPFFRSRDFDGGIALFEEATKARPGDVDFWNNLGLFLREAGRTARNPQKAKAYFERAWKAYNRARLLEPRNVRLLNDTALIDVYYLKEHSKDSEDLLRQAIKVGKPAFARNKKDQVLEEALGDAYMNLGVLLMRDPARLDEAEAALKKSLAFYPHGRRATKMHLRKLEGLRKETSSDKEEKGKVREKGKG